MSSCSILRRFQIVISRKSSRSFSINSSNFSPRKYVRLTPEYVSEAAECIADTFGSGEVIEDPLSWWVIFVLRKDTTINDLPSLLSSYLPITHLPLTFFFSILSYFLHMLTFSVATMYFFFPLHLGYFICDEIIG